MTFKAKIISGLVAAVAMLAAGANAQDVKHYRFAHDQQLNSGYSVAYDIFSAKLKDLSKGTMLVDQYPGAQLGQEPQILQLVKAGDIDFAIVSSANTSTISPQAGVMSLHFLFANEDHIVKALGDPKVYAALRDMIDQTAQVTTTAYDPASRPTAVTDPNTYTTNSGYDPGNRLTAVTDANGNTTTTVYDAANRATAKHTQADVVPSGGRQSSSGAVRSRNGRCAPALSRRRVVATPAIFRSTSVRAVAAPI